MLAEQREKFKKIELNFGRVFSKFFTPNEYTYFSLLLAILALYFLININLVLALIFFLLAAFLDFIDGAVAKFLKIETKRGAFLDTICDRYVEGVILLGFLFLALPKFILPAKIWIFFALFGSFMTTYAKAAAKEKEIVERELKKAFFGRAERIILISLTILLGIFNLSWMIYPLVILALFTNISALQRIILALRKKGG